MDGNIFKSKAAEPALCSLPQTNGSLDTESTSANDNMVELSGIASSRSGVNICISKDEGSNKLVPQEILEQ